VNQWLKLSKALVHGMIHAVSGLLTAASSTNQ